jgi:hypothetical protein
LPTSADLSDCCSSMAASSLSVLFSPALSPITHQRRLLAAFAAASACTAASNKHNTQQHIPCFSITTNSCWHTNPLGQHQAAGHCAPRAPGAACPGQVHLQANPRQTLTVL